MFDAPRLEEAFAIHHACFVLWRWTQGAIESGLIKLNTAHDYMTEGEAAADWISEHYDNLPADGRPRTRRGEPLDRFARFFASYLTASYEVSDSPRDRFVSGCGCYCPLCRYVASAPRVKPRRLTPADRKKAEKLRSTFIQELIARERVQPGADRMARIEADVDLSRDAALGAYVRLVLRRCDGLPCGPEALALWRQVSRNVDGSPKRGFRLTVESVQGAEERLHQALYAARVSRAGARLRRRSSGRGRRRFRWR
jgi:hypothetical protein